MKRFLGCDYCVVAIAMVILALVSIVAQLSMPRDRVLPFVRVNDDRVGGFTERQLVDHLRQRYNDVPLEVHVEETESKTTLAKAGLRVNYAQATDKAFHYPLWQRMLPFSSVAKSFLHNVELSLVADEAILDNFAKKVAKDCYRAPINAQIAMENEVLKVNPEQSGRSCDRDQIKQHIVGSPLQNPMIVTPPYEITTAPRTVKDVRPLLQRAEAVIARQFSVVVGGDSQIVPRQTLAQWLTFIEDKDTHELSLALDTDTAAAYLKGREKSVYIAPGTTVISTTDSIETTRTTGSSGQGIDMAATIEQIKSALLDEDEATIAYAQLAVLPPTVKYNRTYTDSQKGLEAMLQDIAEENGGYGIAVHDLSGKKWSASANGTKRFETASTYKLFVAYSVLKQVEAGQMKWNDSVVGSRDVAQCFDDMIIRSDNPCAEEFGKRLSWRTVEKNTRELGLKSTTFGEEFFSTAADQALFLGKLERGEFLKDESRDRLLDAMKKQIFRRGVPAGTGAVVANKVGFMDGLLHDASIVYNPGGDYVIVIFSQGSTWDDIADASRRIHAFMTK